MIHPPQSNSKIRSLAIQLIEAMGQTVQIEAGARTPSVLIVIRLGRGVLQAINDGGDVSRAR